MAIKLFNLISGQECLVDIHEEKEDSYVCKNILQLIPDPKSGGVAMIGFPMFKEDSSHTEKIKLCVKVNLYKNSLISIINKQERVL